MPMIVYKRMDVDVHHVQMRRIACEHCNAPYTVVAEDNFTASCRGTPGFTADDAMRMIVMQRAFRRLKRAALRARAGIGRCPSCNRVQGWMARHQYLSSIGCLGAMGAVAIPIVAAIGAAILSYDVPPVFWGSVPIGLLLGCVLGVFAAKAEIEGEPGDPRSMTDAEFRRFLRDCDERELDPALTWYYGLLENAQPGSKAMVISLGFLDDLESLPVPTVHHTERVLEVLHAESR